MTFRTLRPRQPLVALEICALCTGIISILGYFARRSTEKFWTDECLTAVMVNDSSLTHMLGALRDEINAFPPLPFVAGWFWVRIFGGSEWSLRLPSLLCLLVAMIAIWLTMRRLTHRVVAAVCAVCVPLLSPLVRQQLVEARPYTLLLAAFSICVYLFVVRGGVQQSRAWDWRVVAAHALLVSCHHLGGVFSALLVAVALLEYGFGRDRAFRNYAQSAIVGWVMVLPSIPFYLAQRRLGGELNWLGAPSLFALFDACTGFLGFAGGAVVIPLVAAYHTPIRRRLGIPELRRLALYPRHVMLLLIAGNAFIPLLWLESQFGLPLFLGRYLIVQVIYWVFIIAFLVDAHVEGEPLDSGSSDTASAQQDCQLGTSSVRQNWLPVAITVIVCTCLFVLISDGRQKSRIMLSHERDIIGVESYRELPVIIGSGNHQDWYVLNHYTGKKRKVYFLIDSTIANRGPRYYGKSMKRQIVLLDAWVRRYETEFRVRDFTQFCREHDTFLFVDSACNPPFPSGISELDEAHSAKSLVATRLVDSVWLVSRRDPN